MPYCAGAVDIFQKNILLHVAAHSFNVFSEICIVKSNTTQTIVRAILCTKADTCLKPAYLRTCLYDELYKF